MRASSMHVTALALLSAALLAAGCGTAGSSSRASTTDSTTGSPSAPGKAAFVARADAICRRVRTSLTSLRGRASALTALGDTPEAFAQAAALLHRARSLEQGELSRLRQLELPVSGTSAVSGFLAKEGRTAALVGRLADAFARGDRSAIAQAEQAASQMAAAARALARGYGFKVCGSGIAGDGLA